MHLWSFLCFGLSDFVFQDQINQISNSYPCMNRRRSWNLWIFHSLFHLPYLFGPFLYQHSGTLTCSICLSCLLFAWSDVDWALSLEMISTALETTISWTWLSFSLSRARRKRVNHSVLEFPTHPAWSLGFSNQISPPPASRMLGGSPETFVIGSRCAPNVFSNSASTNASRPASLIYRLKCLQFLSRSAACRISIIRYQLEVPTESIVQEKWPCEESFVFFLLSLDQTSSAVFAKLLNGFFRELATMSQASQTVRATSAECICCNTNSTLSTQSVNIRRDFRDVLSWPLQQHLGLLNHSSTESVCLLRTPLKILLLTSEFLRPAKDFHIDETRECLSNVELSPDSWWHALLLSIEFNWQLGVSTWSLLLEGAWQLAQSYVTSLKKWLCSSNNQYTKVACRSTKNVAARRQRTTTDGK